MAFVGPLGRGADYSRATIWEIVTLKQSKTSFPKNISSCGYRGSIYCIFKRFCFYLKMLKLNSKQTVAIVSEHLYSSCAPEQLLSYLKTMTFSRQPTPSVKCKHTSPSSFISSSNKLESIITDGMADPYKQNAPGKIQST